MIGLARDQSAALGLIVICVTVLMAVLAPALAPLDPVKNSLVDRLTPPMWNTPAPRQTRPPRPITPATPLMKFEFRLFHVT